MRATVSKIITAVNMVFVVDSDDGEKLVQEMHRHLSGGSSDVRFKYNEVGVWIVHSECPERYPERMYTVEFNTCDVFWVDHRIE